MADPPDRVPTNEDALLRQVGPSGRCPICRLNLSLEAYPGVPPMQGLMQPTPLTLPTIFRRAELLFPDKVLVTARIAPSPPDRTNYGAWAARTRRLGGALDRLGVGPDARVGTFAWNTARHLELYFAVPCTGRVLHTFNIRLFAAQLTYIVNHAEDDAIFLDRSLL